jgi:hypothetical protein
MTDSWLIVEANFPDLNPRSIIRDFVKPVIDESETSLSTFHFFFEPHLLLRMKADKNSLVGKIKPYVDRKLADLHVSNPSVRIDDGYTEEPDYRDGWEIAKRMFEFGSKAAILKAESEGGHVKLGSQFNEGKFIHLLLNQWGYSRSQEAHFHLKAVGERLALIHSGSSVELAKTKLPQILRELENDFFPRIDDMVRRIMAQP